MRQTTIVSLSVDEVGCGFLVENLGGGTYEMDVAARNLQIYDEGRSEVSRSRRCSSFNVPNQRDSRRLFQHAVTVAIALKDVPVALS